MYNICVHRPRRGPYSIVVAPENIEDVLNLLEASRNVETYSLSFHGIALGKKALEYRFGGYRKAVSTDIKL
jgi:3-dehydroquinate dehydratase